MTPRYPNLWHPKLTEAQVRAVVTRYQAGESTTALARDYGVTREAIRLRERGVAIDRSPLYDAEGLCADCGEARWEQEQAQAAG